MSSAVFLAIRVPADPARAFDVFTRDIAAWWRPDPLFPIAPQGDGVLGFEPGRILVWDPGRRLVFVWRQASFPPDRATEVDVRFEPVGDETRVSIEHRAWDSIPQRHVARHGFPEPVTLRRVADWWRMSAGAFRERLAQ
jgi:activator of HSP90 ATPase